MFPFTYSGQQYRSCTDADSQKLWCATTKNYDDDNKWGYCQNCHATHGGNSGGSCCQFPFVYNDMIYHKCIRGNRKKPWCGTTFSYDKDGKWGFCNAQVVAHPKPMKSVQHHADLPCPGKCESHCDDSCPERCCSSTSSCPKYCAHSCKPTCPDECCTLPLPLIPPASPPPLPPAPPPPLPPPIALPPPPPPPPIYIPAPYPSSPPFYQVPAPAPPPTYSVTLGATSSCPAICNDVCIGSCPVSCCTRFPPVASQRVFIPPTAPPPPPYFPPPPVPPAAPYFQPEQQPWPTMCPRICSSRCESSCPIHCCPSSILENLKRLSKTMNRHQAVGKSFTSVSPDSRLNPLDGHKEPSTVLQPPPVPLSPFLSTSSTSSSCPTICSRHCTRACTPECCVAPPVATPSTQLEKRDKVLKRKIIRKSNNQNGKRLNQVSHKRSYKLAKSTVPMATLSTQLEKRDKVQKRKNFRKSKSQNGKRLYQ